MIIVITVDDRLVQVALNNGFIEMNSEEAVLMCKGRCPWILSSGRNPLVSYCRVFLSTNYLR